MVWNIGGITVAGRRLERHRRASRLLQPRHFLRQRKPLYWATAYTPSLGYFHTATATNHSAQVKLTWMWHKTTATVRVCSSLRWFKIFGEPVVEIYRCPSPAHTHRLKLSPSSPPSAPTAGRTSFLKPRVQPSMDPFKHGIGVFPGKYVQLYLKWRYFTLLHYKTHWHVWFRSVNAALINENRLFREQLSVQ